MLLALAFMASLQTVPWPEDFEGPLPQDLAHPLPAPARKKLKSQDPPDGPQEERPRPTDYKARRGMEDLDVKYRVGIDLEYNDNFIRLDRKDFEAFQDGTKPEKFRIRQPDDFIYSPWAEAAVGVEVAGLPSLAGLRLTGYVYQENTFATHEAVNLFLKGKPYELEYTYEPDIYRREYIDIDTGRYASAFYDDHLFEFSMKFPVQRWLLVRPKAGLELRDYDAPFGYRSSVAALLSPRATFTVLPWLEPMVQFDFDYTSAFAVGIQPDVSYCQNGFEVGWLLKPAPKWELEFKYRYEYRIYTTSLDVGTDPSHSGRTDDRHRIVLKNEWKAARNLRVDATFTYWAIQSHLPGKPDLQDEDSTWRRHSYVLGFTYTF